MIYKHIVTASLFCSMLLAIGVGFQRDDVVLLLVGVAYAIMTISLLNELKKVDKK